MTAPYDYRPETLKALEYAISPPRLKPYLVAGRGDLQTAVELHAWNNSLSSALFGPILNVELLVRNSCDIQLRALYGRADWYSAFPMYAGYAYLISQIADAQNKLSRFKKSLGPPQVIANVSFGFWVALFEKHLHRDLWVPALQKAFPHRPANYNRHEAWDGLREIREMRNRIAHHDSLFNRDLPGFQNRMLNLAGYMSPETAHWIKHHSTLDEIWIERP